MKPSIITPLFLLLTLACRQPSPTPPSAAGHGAPDAPTAKQEPTPAAPQSPPPAKPAVARSTPTEAAPTAEAAPAGGGTYAWLTDTYDPDQSLRKRVPLPAGCHWVTEEGHISEWLAGIPLQPAGAQVHLYNGGLKNRQDVHYAIVNMDVGKTDLQQCADAVMRLKAEYHYSRGEYAKIAFKLTSGDRVCFDDWRKGKKPVVKGNKVTFTAASGKADNSYQNFKKYLTLVFNYAGSSSLSKEMKAKDLADIKAGDVFIWGGFPGHAVMVMGVAERDKDGQRFFLLAQSYMPAQEMHLLKNPTDAKLSPWYSTHFTGSLETPEWTFEKADLKKFAE